jgi:signal transduction histidine kinase
MHLIHDLRLVLIAIAASLEAQRLAAGANPLPKEFDHAVRMLETALAISDELLVSSALRRPATQVNVNALIEELAPVIGTIAGNGVTVQVLTGASECRVTAHRVDLERILVNVVANAAAAMRDGGVLTIETTTARTAGGEAWNDPVTPFGNLCLTIRDNGRGMLSRELANAINPMVRPRPDGSGLGLASVALILTRLGGTLGIESKPETGTTVTVLLPLAPANGHVH